MHARGAGAFGYFKVFDDSAKKYTFAPVLTDSSRTTPIFVRFSTVQGSRGRIARDAALPTRVVSDSSGTKSGPACERHGLTRLREENGVLEVQVSIAGYLRAMDNSSQVGHEILELVA